MNREYLAWNSPILGRRMEMLWFGHAGRPMIWFPTSVGRFYQNEDFGLTTAVKDLIEGGAIQFVVPFVRTRAQTSGRITTLGASFGAYHAANFGFRHPDAIDKIVAMSGKYDIHNFLDGYWDELCYFHCPTANVPNMTNEWVGRLNSMDICIVTGQTDNILAGTTDMLRILNEKGIHNRGSVWDAPYGHDWPWWKTQIRSYVP